MTTIDRETLEALQAKALVTFQTLDKAILVAESQKAVRKITDARESAQRTIVGLLACDALSLSVEQATAIGTKLDRLLAILQEKPKDEPEPEAKPSEGGKSGKRKPRAKRTAKRG